MDNHERFSFSGGGGGGGQSERYCEKGQSLGRLARTERLEYWGLSALNFSDPTLVAQRYKSLTHVGIN